MSMTKRYRLADPAAQIPMPDRGGRLFSATPRGEAVDIGQRFYSNLIADGDLVPADAAVTNASQPAKATGRKVADPVPTAKGERA